MDYRRRHPAVQKVDFHPVSTPHVYHLVVMIQWHWIYVVNQLLVDYVAPETMDRNVDQMEHYYSGEQLLFNLHNQMRLHRIEHKMLVNKILFIFPNVKYLFVNFSLRDFLFF